MIHENEKPKTTKTTLSCIFVNLLNFVTFLGTNIICPYQPASHVFQVDDFPKLPSQEAMKSQNASHEAVRCSGTAFRRDMYGAYMVKTLKVHEEYIEAYCNPQVFFFLTRMLF